MKLIKTTADLIKGRSQELCPVDSGDLMGSAYVDKVDDRTYAVGYGGVASDYALEQHENLQYYHPVGQAKFLEQAFEEEIVELLREFRARNL
jgi:hypothetical protein